MSLEIYRKNIDYFDEIIIILLSAMDEQDPKEVVEVLKTAFHPANDKDIDFGSLRELMIERFSAKASECGKSSSAFPEERKQYLIELSEHLENTMRLRFKNVLWIVEAKKKSNIQVEDMKRWDAVLEKSAKIAADKGLDKDYVKDFFNSMHKISIDYQNRQLSN